MRRAGLDGLVLLLDGGDPCPGGGDDLRDIGVAVDREGGDPQGPPRGVLASMGGVARREAAMAAEDWRAWVATGAGPRPALPHARRTAVVQLRCGGARRRIVSVREDGTCRYKVVAETPAVCSRAVGRVAAGWASMLEGEGEGA